MLRLLIACFVAVLMSSAAMAVDLTGHRIRLNASFAILWDDPMDSSSHATIYFAPSGDRFIFLDGKEGVRLRPGQSTLHQKFDDHAYDVELSVSETRLSISIAWSDGSGAVIRTFDVSLKSLTSCKVSKFTYRFSASDTRIRNKSTKCEILGPPES